MPNNDAVYKFVNPFGHNEYFNSRLDFITKQVMPINKPDLDFISNFLNENLLCTSELSQHTLTSTQPPLSNSQRKIVKKIDKSKPLNVKIEPEVKTKRKCFCH